jgi:hypothetical protein
MMSAAPELLTMTKSTTPIVRFDIRVIPKKPPAPSVRRRVKAEHGWTTPLRGEATEDAIG